MKTRDVDIRLCLHQMLNEKYKNDDTIIVDELCLCQGEARLDIAVLNGCLHGYEIKSERDNLERLPNQVEIYNRVLDNITIVSGKNHLNNILDIIPDWWGIDIAEGTNDAILISRFRDPLPNPNTDPYSVVQLLWREEALDVLRRFELDRGMNSKPKKVIWRKLVDSFPPNDLKDLVREKIKRRSDWRADTQHILNGGL